MLCKGFNKSIEFMLSRNLSLSINERPFQGLEYILFGYKETFVLHEILDPSLNPNTSLH